MIVQDERTTGGITLPEGSTAWRIVVSLRDGLVDPMAESVRRQAGHGVGVEPDEVRSAQVYVLLGRLNVDHARRIADEFLTDPVTQTSVVERLSGPHRTSDAVRQASDDWWSVDIAYHSGVMNPWAESIAKGVRDLGISGLQRVWTAQRYMFRGVVSADALETFARRSLYNPLIQSASIAPGREGADGWCAQAIADATRLEERRTSTEEMVLPVISADDGALMRLSREGQFSLNLEEMLEIQRYFRRLKREPRLAELETIAQAWSEHCCHKTMKGDIAYEEYEESPDGCRTLRRKARYNNLLKATIARATKDLDKPWCVSVFKDNAGIIAFDRTWGVAFKAETHNHPSALEPYGGAETGVGGVVRDILGVGLGAKPIMNTDVFCFGPWSLPYEQVPAGALHPKRVMRGVVSGVRDYGNRMGIPTANGAICFDEGFTANPLVYCGTVGLIPLNRCRKSVRRGDRIIVMGGRTGRDGIHGATFSSAELSESSETTSRGAVQIGNAITEKKVLDVLLVARDRDLYRGITDCGAGGLACAVGEMGEQTGAVVELERVPLKYAGLTPTEIWISESQERMVLAVPPARVEALLALCASEDVEATDIGEFDTGELTVRYAGAIIVELDPKFLYGGVPTRRRRAVWTEKSVATVSADPAGRAASAGQAAFESRAALETRAARAVSVRSAQTDLGAALMRVLGDGNICSKESVIRQYDHEVQGMSALKPLTGPKGIGPSDATVLRPLRDSDQGIAVACGINPRYGKLDPYHMAAACIDEAVRQVVAVGATLRRIALLDNFCWGDPEDPEQLGGLVRASQACYDMAMAYGTPFISGKDSLNNTYLSAGKLTSIPPTLLISAVGLVPDVRRIVSMDVKRSGSLVYLVGVTRPELGGSAYGTAIREAFGDELAAPAGPFGCVPRVHAGLGKRVLRAMERAIVAGLARSVHDCSDGGLGVACAEMAFAGGLGMTVDLRRVSVESREGGSRRAPDAGLSDDVLLFSESTSRFLVEVDRSKQAAFERALKGVPHGVIGSVTRDQQFRVKGLAGRDIVNCGLDALERAWRFPLEGVV